MLALLIFVCTLVIAIYTLSMGATVCTPALLLLGAITQLHGSAGLLAPVVRFPAGK
jgi:hypothetical protein